MLKLQLQVETWKPSDAHEEDIAIDTLVAPPTDKSRDIIHMCIVMPPWNM